MTTPVLSAGLALHGLSQKGPGVGVRESAGARGPEGGAACVTAPAESPPVVAAGCYKYLSCLWMLREVT